MHYHHISTPLVHFALTWHAPTPFAAHFSPYNSRLEAFCAVVLFHVRGPFINFCIVSCKSEKWKRKSRLPLLFGHPLVAIYIVLQHLLQIYI